MSAFDAQAAVAAIKASCWCRRRTLCAACGGRFDHEADHGHGVLLLNAGAGALAYATCDACCESLQRERSAEQLTAIEERLFGTRGRRFVTAMFTGGAA